MSRRILVLTSGTGSGHDMRARAFAEWIRHFHGNRIEVRIEQVIENASLLGRFGVWVYNTIHRRAPFLHNLYFFIVEIFISSHQGSVSFGGRYYRRLLKTFQPDLILSVHDSTNRGYFEDARRILGKDIRCVTYCGEFSGGFGYSRNWVNPTADHFIARTEEARQYAIRLGIPPHRSSVFQRLLPPAAFQAGFSHADREALRRQLGLDPDRFTLFLATGGYGANHHLAFLRHLLPLAERLQVIVICGRDKALHESVLRWSQCHPSLRTYVEGYSTRVSDFLHISDAILTRGGANTTMEALHAECPLLYNSLGGLMPQEQCTVRYVLNHGAARRLRKPRDLPAILRSWASFGPDYAEVRAHLRGLQRDEDPRRLIQSVLGERFFPETTPIS
ncbi:MAG: glycosyltransferase [Oceanipulchritudo sp.]